MKRATAVTCRATVLGWCGLLAAAPVAMAGDAVYKSIGPDGKVTYSQAAPVDAKLERKMEFSHAPASALPASVLKFRQEMERSINAKYREATAPPTAALRLVTARWCGYCRQARAYLTAHAVPFQELDLETPAGMADYVRAGGKGGVPLLLGPNLRLQGYTQAYYDAALARR